jgi:hypothetical protein
MIPFTFDQLRRVIDARRGTTKQDTLARLGEALLFVQSVEASFRFVMTFVIQKGQEGLDLEIRWFIDSKRYQAGVLKTKLR